MPPSLCPPDYPEVGFRHRRSNQTDLFIPHSTFPGIPLPEGCVASQSAYPKSTGDGLKPVFNWGFLCEIRDAWPYGFWKFHIKLSAARDRQQERKKTPTLAGLVEVVLLNTEPMAGNVLAWNSREETPSLFNCHPLGFCATKTKNCKFYPMQQRISKASLAEHILQQYSQNDHEPAFQSLGRVVGYCEQAIRLNETNYKATGDELLPSFSNYFCPCFRPWDKHLPFAQVHAKSIVQL
ncbi:hypothetical protein L211DRAFT_864318 [Terfezia boudieri ATCC MYA-4762]|uniref:Uncharacterized protein n=1 Tax=Terfezia boudieri ATCC MYA-4762 TaxID=1051890 RepID=A0A3N4M3W4_9PEZI|nr:hypothetical protein L211DRAFT_864318 [Terfezia boudieri ATCC MYA-4762]